MDAQSDRGYDVDAISCRGGPREGDDLSDARSPRSPGRNDGRDDGRNDGRNDGRDDGRSARSPGRNGIDGRNDGRNGDDNDGLDGARSQRPQKPIAPRRSTIFTQRRQSLLQTQGARSPVALKGKASSMRKSIVVIEQRSCVSLRANGPSNLFILSRDSWNRPFQDRRIGAACYAYAGLPCDGHVHQGDDGARQGDDGAAEVRSQRSQRTRRRKVSAVPLTSAS